MRRSDIRTWMFPVMALVAMLVCWQAAIQLFSMSPLILPSPAKVGLALITHAGQLLSNGGLTLLESVLGFVVGSSFAIGLAVLFLFSTNSERALYPYAIAMK